ncbi:MAG TPA: DinB family protein [Terracidiphilus sp.]|jgi:uncharacterized damage-inducible protein DinB|nr:DinB family protein [Terracidiphilus sp.]
MDFQKELIAEYDTEIEKTRKILAAIPADADFNFKPSPKSMSLGRLAGHTSEALTEWAVHTVTSDALIFPSDYKFEPYIPVSTAALLEKFDQETAKARAALAAFDPAKWETNWKFGVGEQIWIDESKYSVWRNWVIDHTIHHRAQLGVYIRILGGRLPGVYGPSADEM